jgi:DNA-binding GntR family transcriptional regulator
MLEPFFAFLEDETGMRVEYYIARVRPVKALKCRFNSPLPMPGNTPVLEIDEVAYTADGRPIFHTYEYHPENKMSFELIRRRVHR